MSSAFSFAQDLSCPCCYRPGVAVCENFSPADAAAKLSGLRNLLRKHGLGGYIVPMGDAHSSEYVSAADKRIEWLSGFTGSAATVLVTLDAALLWTDGRYFVQAAAQLAGTAFTLMKSSEPGVPTLEEWVATEQRAGRLGSVGVDPTLVSLSGAEEWTAKGCAPLDVTAPNLVDRVWGLTKPARASEPLRATNPAPRRHQAVQRALNVVRASKAELQKPDRTGWLCAFEYQVKYALTLMAEVEPPWPERLPNASRRSDAQCFLQKASSA